MSPRTLPYTVMIALMFLGCSHNGASPDSEKAGATASSGETIVWQDWNDEAFAQARANNTMILIDVGIEGCTACRWMFEDTYAHPEVIRRVRKHFVAIAVDADARPDIGERYAKWGWPATIMMTPEGERLLAIRGNKRPRNFIPILDELIEKQASGTLEPIVIPRFDPLPEDTEWLPIHQTITSALDTNADTQEGGWGEGVKIARTAPLVLSFMRAHTAGNSTAAEHALRSAAGYAKLIDPVWGGLFVGAESRDFTGPIPEKRTRFSGGALFYFAQAYHSTGDARWLKHMASIDRYMRDWMWAPDGTFYATQEDDAPLLADDMTARDYYALSSDPERRQYGIPPIDHGIYTELNGIAIQGYARVYEATQDKEALKMAVTAADKLIETRLHADGWMAHAGANDALSKDERMRPFNAQDDIYLQAQIQFGLALVMLHRVTGEGRYLRLAIEMAHAMRNALEDPELGGFFLSTQARKDAHLGGFKSFADNAVAAHFLMQLSHYTKNEAYQTSAERALRAVGDLERIERMGVGASIYGIALEHVLWGPVEFSVVTTDPKSVAARELFDASLAVYEPRKVLHFEAPGRYPDRGQPAVYVCTRSACSSPITDPAKIAEVAANYAVAR